MERKVNVVEDLEGNEIVLIHDMKFGWYSYVTRFALPVYGEDEEIERYNVF